MVHPRSWPEFSAQHLDAIIVFRHQNIIRTCLYFNFQSNINIETPIIILSLNVRLTKSHGTFNISEQGALMVAGRDLLATLKPTQNTALTIV